MNKIFLIFVLVLTAQGCGTLDKKTVLINAGDEKSRVIEIMGLAQDKQLQGDKEAWQYCKSGAGLGYNDHKVIWFESGKVSKITTYRSHRSGCTGAFKTIEWD